MASIKVSELPSITAITPNDVLIINDEDLVTSNIKISDFTSSFTTQVLSFTGDTSFTGTVQFLAGSSPQFASPTVFNQGVTFNGSITLGALAQIPLGDLSNVTLPTTITNGNVLTWDQANGYWTSKSVTTTLLNDGAPTLGANLNVNGYQITNGATNAGPAGADIEIVPQLAGKLKVYGNSTGGSAGITLNCEANTHGVEIKSPPHADNATYTLVLPTTMGTAGQMLRTDGSTRTSWITVTPAIIGAATAAQGVLADNALATNKSNTILNFADDSAAANGGIPIGGIYRTGNDLKVRLS